MKHIGRYWLVAPTWLILGFGVGLPLVLMLVISFGERGLHGGLKPIEDLSSHILSGQFFQNYARTLDPLYLGIFWRSLWMAVLTTIACLLLGYPMAYYIAQKAKKQYRKILLILVVIPFWTCFLVRTYAWMFILRTEGLANSVLLNLGWIEAPLPLLYNDFSVMLGLIYGELPFMILPLYASLEKLDLSLLEAAKDLGARPFQAFWRITVPLSSPGIAAGTILVFIPSLGQYIVSDLLGGAKSILIGNLIQNQFSIARNKPFGSAISFELMGLVLILILAMAWITKKQNREDWL